ncbi:FAD-binding protein [Shigella flexneri]
MATGGAGRVYRYNTNGGIVTGDGMGMAFRHGVPLRDMEFVQYHPTGLPGLRYSDDRGLPGRRRYSGQQRRLPLFTGLRHGPGNPARSSGKQIHGTRPAR